MKILIAILTLFLIGTTSAMNFTEEAYYQGIQEGYHLGYLAMAGQSDAAKEAEYNDLIANLNIWLESVGYTDAKWGDLPKNSVTLPPIFADYNKPLIVVNESNASDIIHEIDGANGIGGAKYTTNDGNLLSESARDQLMGAEGTGDKKVYTKPGAVDYLGGV